MVLVSSINCEGVNIALVARKLLKSLGLLRRVFSPSYQDQLVGSVATKEGRDRAGLMEKGAKLLKALRRDLNEAVSREIGAIGLE